MPSRGKEPSWHKKLRRDRARARVRLQNPSELDTELLERSINLLDQHHGSQPPQIAMARVDRTGDRTRKWAAEADQ